MQRIAVPMIGGVASSTLLTLEVIRTINSLTKGWGLEPSIGSQRARTTVDGATI
jgi:Cu(I)/Ag(I) efflux system membrane protein CusA/SilA